MPTVQEFLDVAFEAFEEEQDFRSRRLLKPLYADYPTFKALVTGLDGMVSAVTVQALRSVAPFAPQLYLPKDFANDRVRILNGASAPDKVALLSATCRSFARMGWGRRR